MAENTEMVTDLTPSTNCNGHTVVESESERAIGDVIVSCKPDTTVQKKNTTEEEKSEILTTVVDPIGTESMGKDVSNQEPIDKTSNVNDEEKHVEKKESKEHSEDVSTDPAAENSPGTSSGLSVEKVDDKPKENPINRSSPSDLELLEKKLNAFKEWCSSNLLTMSEKVKVSV